MTVPSAALAAAPPNDTYRNATQITSLPYEQEIDLTEATDDPYPPCEAASHRRIWYTFTPASDHAIRVTVGGDTTAELALWTVEGGGPKAIQRVRCAVDGRDLVDRLNAGTKYAISVGQWIDGSPLVATLTITVEPPPANDDFANATDITGPSFTAAIDEGAAAAAGTEPGEPTPSCTEGVPLTSSMWYRYSAPGTSRVSYTILHISTLGVYSGTTLASLSEIACSIQGGNGSFQAQAGEVYYFQVIPSSVRETNFSVDILPAPTNDAFRDAIAIGQLPATVSADLTLATVEGTEPGPSCALSYGQTVWWQLTPTATGTLTGYVGDYDGFWAIYSGSTLTDLTEVGCGLSGFTTLRVVGGQPIAIQVGRTLPRDGIVRLDLSFREAPTNDDFANATLLALGDSILVDTAGATVEPFEAAPPSCGFWPGASVWFDLVGTGDPVSFGLSPGSTFFAIAAYSGSDLASLTPLGCRLFPAPPLTITPAPGERIHVQLWAYAYCCGTTTTLTVQAPGSPTPAFATLIPDPSVFDDVLFIDQTQDPGGNPITSWAWDFGDGSTSSLQNPLHRFAADGSYDVTLAVVTSDGRTGSATRAITVQTHDVGIARILVPSRARAGQTKQITVGLGNRRYPETASVRLLASRTAGGWEEVGVVTQAVPVTSGGQTVDFQFSYTFTAADAAAGKVTFRAIATLTSARDSFPADNEATSLATKVTS